MASRVSFLIIAKDGFSKVAKKISKRTKVMKKSFHGLGRGIKDLSGKFKGLVLAATAYIGIGKFFKEGMAFQDSIANLSAITGAAGKDLKFYSDETLRLAKASKIAQSTVGDVFTQVASAKSELLKDPKGLSIVTEQVLLLANASGIELPAATKAAVGSLNQFNKGADQAARFVNVLAAGSKVGASLVGETADALKNVGAVASSFNITFEETNALIQVLAKNEIKGAEGGTKLRGAIAAMVEIGGKFDPNKWGMIKALENLDKAGWSANKMLKKFGRENVTAALILRANVPLIKQWKEQITGTSSATEQAIIRMATFSTHLRGVGVDINDKLIRVFAELEEKGYLTNMADDFNAWVQTISSSDLKNAADSIRLIAESILLVSKALQISMLFLKGFGTTGGEVAAQWSTLNFDLKNRTPFNEAFSIDEIKRILEMDVDFKNKAGKPAPLEDVRTMLKNSPPLSRMEALLNINIKDPFGIVQKADAVSITPYRLEVGENVRTSAI